MLASATDRRITEAVSHLQLAMRLLEEAGARQSAAHAATAILCLPPPEAGNPAPLVRHGERTENEHVD